MPIRTTSTRYSDLAAPALPSVFSIASAADADHRGPTMSPADLMMPGATPLLAARRRPSSSWPAWSRAWSGWGCPPFHGPAVLIMAPAQAAALLVVPSLVTNLWQARPAATFGPICAPHRRHAGGRLRRHAGGRLVAGRAIRRWAGVCLRRAGPVRGLGPVRFATLHSHAARARWAWRWAPRRDWSPQPPACLRSRPCLSAGAEPGQGRADPGHGNLLLGVHAGAGGGHVAERQLRRGCGGALLLPMPLPALLGMGLGQWLRGRLSPRVFKLCFMASLALLGIYQVFRVWLARAILGERRLPSGRGCFRPDAPRRASPRLTRARRRSSSGPMAIDISRQRASLCCTDWILMRA